MRKNENIARFSADKIRREIARLADKDEGPLAAGWESTVMVGLPPAKQDIHIRLDGDILDWFKARGKGYQTRINAVLRAFVQTRQRVERKPAIRTQSRRAKQAT